MGSSGFCCNKFQSSSEEFLLTVIQNLELTKLNYDMVKKLFYINNGNIETILTENKISKKLSNKTLTAMQNTLNKISKENFIKLSQEFFYKNDPNKNGCVKYHNLLFSKIYDKSSLNKDEILFTLMGFMKNDKATKVNLFIESFNSDKIEYEKFKNKLLTFIEFNLITFQTVFLLDDDNIKKKTLKKN